jgi:hypothetical protein
VGRRAIVRDRPCRNCPRTQRGDRRPAGPTESPSLAQAHVNPPGMPVSHGSPGSVSWRRGHKAVRRRQSRLSPVDRGVAEPARAPGAQ